MRMRRSNMNKKIRLIFDGNNLAFRVGSVMSLNNEDGEEVGVPFGCIKSIRYIIDKFKPDRTVVCWDGGRSKVRYSIHPEYKGKRTAKGKDYEANKAKRDNIINMIDPVVKLYSCLGISQYRYKGVEGDDLIAHLVLNSSKFKTIIISSDKDFLQLVGRYVDVYNPITDKLITRSNFKEFKGLGFSPAQYLEYHIMLGDKSDNIFGIPGIGE